jgi:hypothetical protein
VRNAARLYEPVRRLPHMARTLIPFGIAHSPLSYVGGDPLSHLYEAGKVVP